MTKSQRLAHAKKWLTALFKQGGLHSPLGPSGAKRWLNCTASHLWTEHMTEEEREFAAEGSWAHAVSEYCRVFDVPVADLLGLKTKYSKKFSFEVGNEAVIALQGFIDRAKDFDGDVYVEEIVHYTDWVDNGWGTADDFRINEEIKTVKVTDLKYGQGVFVPVEENEQQKLYGAGIIQDFGPMYGIDEDWKFILCVDQPRRNYYAEWEISYVDLVAWMDDYVTERAVIATDKSRATFVSDIGQKDGHTWCTFCKGKAICRKRAQDALSINVENEGIGPSEIAALLPRLPAIKKFCNDLEEEALRLAIAGVKIQADGEQAMKLVRGNRSRFWKNERAAEEYLLAKEFSEDDLYEKKFISVAKAEKLEGISPAEMANENLFDYSQGSLALVPGSDSRPAANEELKSDSEFSE